MSSMLNIVRSIVLYCIGGIHQGSRDTRSLGTTEHVNSLVCKDTNSPAITCMNLEQIHKNK